MSGKTTVPALDRPPSQAPFRPYDVVELTEDVSNSSLWNPDLAPTTVVQRTWSTYHIAALWIGMSVVITTYTLASGLMQQGMTWWQAMITILLGNTIVLIPMVLNAHAGTKYGVSFPVLCRASFGVRGANVPAILRALVACGWFGIQTWIGGLALNTLVAAAWPAWSGMGGITIWISFAAFWLVQVAIILYGLEGIKKLESWSAPLLLAGGALLLMWAAQRGGGLGRILGESSRLQTTPVPFWQLFPAALTANVGYWATLSLNIPDFTRYARSQRSQALGQALGLPATMTAFAFIGVAVTSATIVIFGEAIWDPVALIARIGSAPVIVFGALIVLVAQLTTNMAANVVSPANDFSSLSPRRISYVAGGLITAVLGIVMMPWKLYADAAAYIFTWLVGYSSLMGAIGGVLITDYWILRRRHLDLAELFKLNGRYSYSNGINRRALIALVVAVLPVVPGFLRAATTPGGVVTNPGFLDTLYTYAWFVTFVLSGVVYLGLMSVGSEGDGGTGS
jgi:NCS1 family nucleobase:cation symporter-1